MTQPNWAGIVVSQVGDWTDAEEHPERAERGIVLLFFPSASVLDHVAQKCDRLVRNFNSPLIEAAERTRSLTCLGELVHDLTAREQIIAACGRVPVAQWSDARRRGVSLIVWPIAAYLPFVAGPMWMAVTGQLLIAQRREYHSQLSAQFSQLCARLRRSADRTVSVEEIPVCFYEQHDGKETWREARRTAVVRDEDDEEKGRWYPDPSNPSAVVPLEHMRGAVSLSEFVAYALRAPTEEATAWRTRLRDNLREFDLSATPW